jgi:hypothetical protein
MRSRRSFVPVLLMEPLAVRASDLILMRRSQRQALLARRTSAGKSIRVRKSHGHCYSVFSMERATLLLTIPVTMDSHPPTKTLAVRDHMNCFIASAFDHDDVDMIYKLAIQPVLKP